MHNLVRWLHRIEANVLVHVVKISLILHDEAVLAAAVERLEIALLDGVRLGLVRLLIERLSSLHARDEFRVFATPQSYLEIKVCRRKGTRVECLDVKIVLRVGVRE